MELLLGDYFALVFPDIPVLCFFNPYAIASFNGRIISTSNLEVRPKYKQSLECSKTGFPFHLRAQSDNCLPCSRSVLIDVCFHIAASDWIMLQEENSPCKFGALQVIKVVRARSIQREARERKSKNLVAFRFFYAGGHRYPKLYDLC